MDIRNWPLGQIMQLPDSCFGRRFAVSASPLGGSGTIDWDMSEVGLPERCVLWELVYFEGLSSGKASFVRIALGDQLPTAASEMDALEPLLYGLGIQGAEPRDIYVGGVSQFSVRQIRQLIEAKGRRLIAEIQPQGVETARCTVVCVVSSIPTEVPDCLLSAHP